MSKHKHKQVIRVSTAIVPAPQLPAVGDNDSVPPWVFLYLNFVNDWQDANPEPDEWYAPEAYEAYHDPAACNARCAAFEARAKREAAALPAALCGVVLTAGGRWVIVTAAACAGRKERRLCRAN